MYCAGRGNALLLLSPGGKPPLWFAAISTDTISTNPAVTAVLGIKIAWSHIVKHSVGWVGSQHFHKESLILLRAHLVGFFSLF